VEESEEAAVREFILYVLILGGHETLIMARFAGNSSLPSTLSMKKA
jgi:hypothetical protein